MNGGGKTSWLSVVQANITQALIIKGKNAPPEGFPDKFTALFKQFLKVLTKIAEFFPNQLSISMWIIFFEV